jgi:hypothetical protein
MLGFGSLPETQEEWKELFERMYGVAAPFFGSTYLAGPDHEGMEERLREAYGPVTSDVDTTAVLADKQRVMDAKPQSYVPKIIEDKPKEDDDLWNQIFLMSLMEEMQGGKPGQAPGVVLGGRSGNLPSMMGQFSRQRKPWWIV